MEDHYYRSLEKYPFIEKTFYEHDREVASLLETLWFKAVLLMEKILCSLPFLEILDSKRNKHIVTWKQQPIKPVKKSFTIQLQSNNHLFQLKLVRSHDDEGASTRAPRSRPTKKETQES